MTYFRCPGYLRGGYGDEWPLPSLAGHGIATLCITRPLLPRTWTQQAADDYTDALAGIEAAVKLLHARGLVDRRRVGMGGMSYGAEVVAWVARNSSLLGAASLANHQVSPAWYWAGALLDGRVETVRGRWGLEAPDETPQQWALLSPAAAVDRIETPLLMQIPESEFRSNLEFHVRMVRAGKPSELWVFPEETHVKQRPRVKLAAYRRNLDWFRFWLQGWSDPDPSKAEQYRRWHDMRERQCARPERLQSHWYCG